MLIQGLQIVTGANSFAYVASTVSTAAAGIFAYLAFGEFPEGPPSGAALMRAARNTERAVFARLPF